MTSTAAPSRTGQQSLRLGFGFQFDDLYRQAGLARLDAEFLGFLSSANADLATRLIAARSASATMPPAEASELVVAIAPHLERFIGQLFGITDALNASHSRHQVEGALQTAKRKFVAKRVNAFKDEQLAALDINAITAALESKIGTKLDASRFAEDAFAVQVEKWMADEKANAADLKLAAEYSAWACRTATGQAKHHHGVLFKLPHKLDMNRLVPTVELTINGTPQFAFTPDHWRQRKGFELTDRGTDLRGALDQVGYCIKCHHQDKDSCSHGLREKNGTPKSTVFGVPLAGCPLEEKISEMHEVKGEGYTVGALAIITIDNPMCAATGHRICNDCMKSCIYQKQEPVDIPQAETRTLKDVLELPWGFEIYSLLTRWNPLNLARPMPKEPTGKKVLVVGLGPAGFTLAHHLMNDGHTVVAVDGLKIEPLPPELSGVDHYGHRVAFKPVFDVRTELYEHLGERVMAGFGGVAEYGITVRWDKNFLKLIRLLLERRSEFAMFGGVRFGGTITIDSAFDMGFDHVALCTGAGRPTVIPMKNGLVRGVRQASDFLMALQLTGAAKTDTLANLQVRLPVVVIGGGLTAIDTATESLAYYPIQVEKFLRRYEALVAARGETEVRKSWTAEEAGIANEFILHARTIRAELAAAVAEGRQPKVVELLNHWGGVTVAYRRRLIDAPSYTLNHEEVAKALEEGIRFAECLSPEAVETDNFGAAAGLTMERMRFDASQGKLEKIGERVTLPARTILVAAGTQPNTVLAREDVHNVKLDGRFFRALDEQGNPVRPEKTSKPSQVHVLMSLRPDGRAVSFFGDLHPSFAGNVVKAMGGAKQGYPVVSRVLSRLPIQGTSSADLIAKLNGELRAVVHDVIRLTPNIVEVVVKAPLAARAFKPGQFYRLQNFETLAAKVDVDGSTDLRTTLGMEGLALTGAKVDVEQGLLSTIVLEMGGSSDLCALLKKGEPVILMGPTGTPTETPPKETVMLVGGGLGNAVLFSIGQRLREEGSRVVYFAGYKKLIDRYKVHEIELAADVVIWCSDEAPGFTPSRTQDRSFVGNIVQAIVAYATNALGEAPISLSQVDRVIAIGSDGMMRAVAEARHKVLKPYLKPDHEAIGSINSPMQCMMKEICAQCLQVHHDPVTGQEDIVFSCANQDQHLDRVRFDNLRDRLSQNGTQEKLTKQWIDYCLKKTGLRRDAESVQIGMSSVSTGLASAGRT